MSIRSSSPPSTTRAGALSEVSHLGLILSAWFGRFGPRLGLGLQRRRQRRALAELDERLLADLGLTRAQAARETARPFWR